MTARVHLGELVKMPASLNNDARKVAALQRAFETDAPAYLAVRIASAEDYTFADALLSEVVTKKDAAIAMRKTATGPLYGVIRTVESWFKPLLDAIAPAEKHLRGVMGAWRVEQEARELEARELAAVAAESDDAPALVEALTIAQEASAKPEARSSTAFGWYVERIAEDMLPDEYWIPDRARLDAIAKEAGASTEPPIVPGVIFKRTAKIGARR